MNLTKETLGLFRLLAIDPVFHCTVWEDNESCITVAKSPNVNPRTNHISIKYHHSLHFSSDGTVIMKSIIATD